MTNNFNFLVSTSRFNEINARAELWFTLLVCGDRYPIISSLEFQGLLTAFTALGKVEVISKIKELLKTDPDFFQYILKIVPIDFVCKTDIDVIKEIIQRHHKEYLKEDESFRIDLKRRNNENINRTQFIKVVAEIFSNKVDLDNPDKIIRIEILGNFCGISFLQLNDIIKAPIERDNI
ncbi:MAG: THUMP domain-containing protein [Candidatus Lokiarchaeota archaeon]|nr:THUMP domain-containing protein [Candidatus Lokiarchaeota archaeon]